MKSNKEQTATKSVFTLNPSAKIISARMGERTSNEVKPQLELARQINKFKLNKLASTAMNVQNGDRVKILINTGSETIDGRYLLVVAKEDEKNSAKLLSTVKTGYAVQLFNFSGVYSKMWQATTDATDKGGEAFVAEGSATKNEKGAVYMKNKVSYDLIPVEGIDADNPLVVDDNEYSSVFALVSPEVIEGDDDEDVANTSTEEVEA